MIHDATTVVSKRFITFVYRGLSESGKTEIWGVRSLGGQPLGAVSWYAQWRRYTFLPRPEFKTVFDANCLREIAEFCEEATQKQRT